MNKEIKFVFFGSSQFSSYVLGELEKVGFSPVYKVTSARENLDIEKLRALEADVFIVASFGKILPREIIDTHNDDKALAFVIEQLKEPEKFMNKVALHLSRPNFSTWHVEKLESPLLKWMRRWTTGQYWPKNKFL